MATKKVQPKSRSQTELQRERKIQEYRQRISEGQKTITDISSQQDRMCETDIVGTAVRHKLFGAGTITEQYATYITVGFDFGSKRFLMPSAFVDGFLKTEDMAMNDRISEYLCMQQKIRETKEDMSAASHAISALEARR